MDVIFCRCGGFYKSLLKSWPVFSVLGPPQVPRFFVMDRPQVHNLMWGSSTGPKMVFNSLPNYALA